MTQPAKPTNYVKLDEQEWFTDILIIDEFGAKVRFDQDQAREVSRQLYGMLKKLDEQRPGTISRDAADGVALDG